MKKIAKRKWNKKVDVSSESSFGASQLERSNKISAMRQISAEKCLAAIRAIDLRLLQEVSILNMNLYADDNIDCEINLSRRAT